MNYDSYGFWIADGLKPLKKQQYNNVLWEHSDKSVAFTHVLLQGSYYLGRHSCKQ